MFVLALGLYMRNMCNPSNVEMKCEVFCKLTIQFTLLAILYVYETFLFYCKITVFTLTVETSVHVMFRRGKTCWFDFKRCPTVDNAALFWMKGHSVIDIIITPG